MTYVFADWDRVSKRLSAAKSKLFLFDIDGTLAPIAKTPHSVKIPSRTLVLLEALSKSPLTKVGVISGRSLETARRMVGLKRLIYSGNHGLEIHGPRLKKFVHPSANRQARSFVTFVPHLQQMIRTVPGVWIENKGLTISIHYRGVQSPHMSRFQRMAKNIIALTRRNRFLVTQGKKVLEIRPRLSWDKGAALDYIRRRISPAPCVVFIGDDVTDEAAFGRLRPHDLGIRVGKRPGSKATHYLRRQSEVNPLLKRFLKP